MHFWEENAPEDKPIKIENAFLFEKRTFRPSGRVESPEKPFQICIGYSKSSSSRQNGFVKIT